MLIFQVEVESARADEIIADLRKRKFEVNEGFETVPMRGGTSIIQVTCDPERRGEIEKTPGVIEIFGVATIDHLARK